MSDYQGQYLRDEILNQIEKKILQSKMSPGSFFGTEEQLCNEFKVSRNIIRDALGRLQGLGILKSKRKVGLVIGKVDPMELFEIGLSFYTCSISDFQQLSKLRFIIEIGAVEDAVQNATEEQLQKLTSIGSKYEESIYSNSNLQVINKLDIDFHSLILEATGNEFIYRLHGIITAYFEKANQILEQNVTKKKMANDLVKEFSPTLWAHKMIIEAFKERDAERAKCLMIIHLKEGIQYQSNLQVQNISKKIA